MKLLLLMILAFPFSTRTRSAAILLKGLRSSLLPFLLLLLSCDLSAQWAQGKGNAYTAFSFTYLRYHEVIDGANFRNGFEHHSIERYVSDHTLTTYIEYGLSDRFTAVLDLPFKIQRTGDELLEAPDDRYTADTVASGRLNAFGNLRSGFTYALSSGTYHWALELMAGMRTASYRAPSGLRSGYDAWFATPRLSVGRGWEDLYFSASLGYRYKTNGYADDLVSRNEVGYKWQRGEHQRTWFIFTMGALIPVTKGGYDDGNSVHTGLYRDREGYVDPGLKINHYLSEHWAINLSSIGAIWARHGGNELTYTGGVSYEW